MPIIKNVPEASWVKVSAISEGLEIEEGDEGMVVDDPDGGKSIMSEDSGEAVSVPEYTYVDVLSEASSPETPLRPEGAPYGSRSLTERIRGYGPSLSERVRQGLRDKPLGQRVGETSRALRLTSGQALEDIDELSGEAYTIGAKAARGVRRTVAQFSGNVRIIGSVPIGVKVKALETDEESGVFEGDEGVVKAGPRGRTRGIHFEDTDEFIEPRQNLQVKILTPRATRAPRPTYPGFKPTLSREDTTDREEIVRVPDRRFRRGFRYENLFQQSRRPSGVPAAPRNFRPVLRDQEGQPYCPAPEEEDFAPHHEPQPQPQKDKWATFTLGLDL